MYQVYPHLFQYLWFKIQAPSIYAASGKKNKIHMGLSENVGYIPNEIAI